MLYRLGKIELNLIYVTPSPGLPGLEGTHDGMACAMIVFGGVLVAGGVAAADMAALQTKAQMNPAVSRLQAFFTAIGSAGSNVMNVG